MEQSAWTHPKTIHQSGTQNAWLAQTEVTPGAEVSGKVYLRPFRGERVTRDFKFRLPSSLGKGEHRIMLSDAESLNRMQMDREPVKDPKLEAAIQSMETAYRMQTEAPEVFDIRKESDATLKLYAADRPDGDARLIVNQATSQASGERTAETLRRACGTFLGRAPEFAGIIRRDHRVPDAIRRQALLLSRHPISPAGADVERIAAKL